MLKASLRAPEGRWAAASERRATTNFSDTVVSLSLAELPGDGGEPLAQFLLFNTQHLLYICYPQSLEREPLRVVDFRYLGGGSGTFPVPTCHAHTPTAKDELDLAVGLSTGEVVLLSLRAQLRASASNTRPVTSMSLNVDGSANASRCVSLAWLPGSDGCAFVAAHRDGAVLLYHKVVGSSSDTKLLARSSSQHTLRPPITQLQGPGAGGGVNAAAVSPDGRHVAVACKDGVLRVYAYHSGGGLVAGFKSYYGGLLCCCWSPDGRYVAAGGEDDMLAVYGLAERCVVAYCQGHSSWVSGVAFDPWMCHAEVGGPLGAAAPDAQAAAAACQQQGADGSGAAAAESGGGGGGGTGLAAAAAGGLDRVYRLASVGQDCQLALWDIAVSEEAVAAAQQASSSSSSPDRGRAAPGLPPSPSKRRSGRGGASRSASPVKRASSSGGSAAGGGLRHRVSGSGAGAADPGALPAALAAGLVAPPLPRADWPLVTPVVQQRAHPEPACSVLFTEDALYSACHGSSVRRWARPALTQQAVLRRIDSLQGLQQGDR